MDSNITDIIVLCVFKSKKKKEKSNEAFIMCWKMDVLLRETVPMSPAMRLKPVHTTSKLPPE